MQYLWSPQYWDNTTYVNIYSAWDPFRYFEPRWGLWSSWLSTKKSCMEPNTRYVSNPNLTWINFFYPSTLVYKGPPPRCTSTFYRINRICTFADFCQFWQFSLTVNHSVALPELSSVVRCSEYHHCQAAYVQNWTFCMNGVRLHPSCPTKKGKGESSQP